MTDHLTVEDISVRFGGVLACDGIDLSVREGGITGLIGPNGSGKTTLFNVIGRFQEYESGTVRYRERSVDGRKPHHMIGLGMARTFQNINLFKEQTTLDNILVGAHNRIGNPFANMFSLPSARRNERDLVRRAIDIAESLHLEDDLDNLVKNLPYGHQKRVELARALVSQPEMILLDEPVAGCNEDETGELQNIVTRVNQESGITFLLVEHDMSMVMKVCDHIYAINFGANLADGTPAQIKSNPDVIRAYLGEDQEEWHS